MSASTTLRPIVESLPDPTTIRARLSDLAAETELLRALLRLWEHRECGRRVLRRRRDSQQGVTHG
jgi:hypothetical protein